MSIATLDEAIAAVLADEPPDTAVDRAAIVEHADGWVLFPQARAYVETGDLQHMRIGSGGTLVRKADGRLFRFASAQRLEENLRLYEHGWLEHEVWDLVVSAVHDPDEAARAILELGIEFVECSFEAGTHWRIPTRYGIDRLRELLAAPPVRLRVGSIAARWRSYEALQTQPWFSYRLEPNEGFENPA